MIRWGCDVVEVGMAWGGRTYGYISNVCLLHACYVLTECLLHSCCVLAACLLHACFVLAACLLHACCVLAACLLRACCVKESLIVLVFLAWGRSYDCSDDVLYDKHECLKCYLVISYILVVFGTIHTAQANMYDKGFQYNKCCWWESLRQIARTPAGIQ